MNWIFTPKPVESNATTLTPRGFKKKTPNDLKNLKTRLYYETEEVLELDF